MKKTACWITKLNIKIALYLLLMVSSLLYVSHMFVSRVLASLVFRVVLF